MFLACVDRGLKRPKRKIKQANFFIFFLKKSRNTISYKTGQKYWITQFNEFINVLKKFIYNIFVGLVIDMTNRYNQFQFTIKYFSF